MAKEAKQKFNKQGEPLNEFGLTQELMQMSIDTVSAVKETIFIKTGQQLEVVINGDETLMKQSLVKRRQLT